MQNNVLDYLNNIVKIKPEKVAFSNGDYDMTFEMVYNQSRAIASFLHSQEVYKEPVMVFMEKHPKTITAYFGVITAGNYYVPIDAEMPETRIKLIMQNTNSSVIICDDKTKEIAETFEFDGQIVSYDQICKHAVDEEAIKKIYDSSIDTDPIYIVFTSGSTGIPKGVVACHRSVIDYIEQLSDVMGFNENTIFGNQTPLYLDACFKEVYPTLKFGATTYLIPKELFMFPIKLVEFLNQYEINTICWVVSALTMISAFGAFKTAIPQYIHTIAFGSEVFAIKQFNLWRKALPNATFVNLYGPTEGTGMCCYYKVNRDFELDQVIPIGRPFKNTDIILLNEKNEKADEGEICIRGTSVTLGYFNNWEKTNEVYVQNPLNDKYPELIYRTGDIARYNEYGELVFVSRKDYQIKHMGHRIELGEIEANVSIVDGINLSACIYDEKKGKIVLYYIGDIDEKQVINVLKEKLPRYMIPNRIIKVQEIPFTANGKINRLALKGLYEKEG